MLRWWDGVDWSAAVRPEAAQERTPPPGGYDAYLAQPVTQPTVAATAGGPAGAAADQAAPKAQPPGAFSGPPVQPAAGQVSPQLRGRMTFAGVIAGVILVCAIAVSAFDGGNPAQAGVGPGSTGNTNPYPTPSYSTPPVTQTLSDPTIGVAVPFPDGWQATGGDQQYPQLVTGRYDCADNKNGCAHGVAEIGNATGTSLRAAALEVAAPLNAQAAHGQPDQITLGADRGTTVQGHPAYVLGWNVTSHLATAPAASAQIVMVDTNQADPQHAGRTLYSFLYVSLDQAPGTPSPALFDQVRAAIQVHPPVLAPSPSS
jgi:hypothetical protein